MKANKAKNTRPELALRRLLRVQGLSGYKTSWRHVPGRPDVAFPSKKVAVFLNGCFWHRCPYCRPTLPRKNRSFWKKKFTLNKLRDIRKSRELRALGWKPIVVWECFLKKRPRRLGSVLSDIHRATGESALVDH